jgi:hypothetical protein
MIFSPTSIEAILAGRKTMTRRRIVLGRPDEIVWVITFELVKP